MKYEDALDQCLTALRNGQDLEAVLARLPQHRERLRRDVALARALRTSAGSLPGPQPVAAAQAASRLRDELQSQRGQREEAREARRPFLGLGIPRLALAFGALVIAVLGLGVMAGSGGFGSYVGGGTAEAAVLEGVVVDSGSGTLTVQTMDRLEQVSVPGGVPISDTRGAVLDLSGIRVGEVVSIRGNRQAGSVVAAQVERLVEGLEGWCSPSAERCKAITGQLEKAEAECRSLQRSCRIMLERLHDVRTRASGIVNLQDLRGRCQSGARPACHDVLDFCSRDADICQRFQVTGNFPEVRDRLREASQSCVDGDALSCRLIGRLCEAGPLLCPDEAPVTTPRGR